MKRHAVPQNIMDVEFKLFGSLSIRQFGLLAINVVFALFFYATPLPDLLKWPIVLFFVGLGFAMALITVNGIPFTTWLGNFILAVITSQKRVWKKSERTPDILRGSYKAEGKYTTHKITSARNAVREMPLLADEAFITAKKVDKNEEQELLTIDKHLNQNYTEEELKAKKAKINPPAVKSTEHEPISKMEGHNLAGKTGHNSDNLFGTETGGSINVTKMEKNVTVNRPFKRRADVEEEPEKQGIANPEKIELKKEVVNDEKVSTGVKEMEKVSASNEEFHKVEAPIVEDAKPAQAEKIENKEDELLKRISELENQLKQEQQNGSGDNLDKQTEIVREIDKVSDEIKNSDSTTQSANNEVDKEPKEDGIELTIKPAQRPNIVVGVVLSQDDHPISDVTVEIKDDQSFPLRKVKTDSRGQFSIPTPLPNGEYLIDFDKKGRKFTDYRVTLRGQILPILKFKESGA